MDRRVFIYSVIASLVASLAFYLLLEPVTAWLWNYTSNSAKESLVELQNAAFRNAAIGKRDWVSAVTFIGAGALCSGILTGLITGLWILSFFGQRVTGAVVSTTVRRKLRVGFLSLFTLFAVGFTYSWVKMWFLVYVDLQLNASFSQRLDAVGPYIELIEERRLRSAWALMRSREDYERINARLDEIGRTAAIDLPEPLYK